jgi:hypothetical protein
MDAFYFYVNQSIPGAGFIDVFSGDVLDIGAPDFASYDGISPVGPLSADELFLAPFETTGGLLNLSSTDDLTFSTVQVAGTTPEPYTFALCLSGLGVLALVIRKSRIKIGGKSVGFVVQ